MKKLIITAIGAIALLATQSATAKSSGTGYPFGSRPIFTVGSFDAADSDKYSDWDVVDSITTGNDDVEGNDYDLLTNGNDYTFADTGKKWDCGKAGKIKYKYNKKTDSETWSVSGNSGNLSGLKLSYNVKKGTFSGSFKVYLYNFEKHKIKSMTAKIKGTLDSDGYGYGTATIKKYGEWEVVISPSEDYVGDDDDDDDDSTGSSSGSSSSTKPSYSSGDCALCGDPVTPSTPTVKPTPTPSKPSGSGCALCGD